MTQIKKLYCLVHMYHNLNISKNDQYVGNWHFVFSFELFFFVEKWAEVGLIIMSSDHIGM